MTAIRSGRFVSAHPQAIMARKLGVAIDRIVLHTMEGTLSGSLAWFSTGAPPRQVPTAAHYLVGRHGDVVQMVLDEAKCYHAGGFNSRSIGVEHEARTTPWPVQRGKDGALRLPPFGSNEFPHAMLAASAEVVRTLCAKFDIPIDREHVIGHYEVPGATHTDPGAAWPWAAYMVLVGETGTG